VNSTRFRSSVTWKMFLRLSITSTLHVMME
jgi:hypothetical protein